MAQFCEWASYSMGLKLRMKGQPVSLAEKSGEYIRITIIYINNKILFKIIISLQLNSVIGFWKIQQKKQGVIFYSSDPPKHASIIILVIILH